MSTALSKLLLCSYRPLNISKLLLCSSRIYIHIEVQNDKHRQGQLTVSKTREILGARSFKAVAGTTLLFNIASKLSSCRCKKLQLALASISTSIADCSSGGGNGNNGAGQTWGGSGGGGDGYRSSSMPARAREDPESLPEAIVILDVGGMSCGGCAASVKKILEAQASVTSASVNLATETALVHLNSGNAAGNLNHQLGEVLAKYLTNCGFKSTVRDRSLSANPSSRRREERLARLKESGRRLAAAWALVSVCLVGHASHVAGQFIPAWAHLFHSVGAQMSICIISLAGPGRKILVDGWKSFQRHAPNMNTLVGLGAVSSFAVSCAAAFLPNLGWQAFFEEPVMLLAFVLLGRSLEERAKLRASSDMEALLNLLPKKARLVVGNISTDGPPPTVEVPCETIAVGDLVMVLPGDRIPIDGIVKGGKTTVDESSLTGESLPVLKDLEDEVSAGTINCNGTITVQAKRQGCETTIGDIVRMVEAAQTREAPIQRLADKVAGNFCYGVMALSAATFGFWSIIGAQLFPAVVPSGGGWLLGLQLACNVLVIACPCALGLATPTAVLVGTSLGARKGLLIRGGDILEKTASIDTIIFDKTGTLTLGRPSVTEIILNQSEDALKIEKEVELLRFASGVEHGTSHPIARAIRQAAAAKGCIIPEIKEGSFEQEPGQGATAVIEGKRITVGTLDWVRRYGANGIIPEIPERVQAQTVVYVGVDDCIAGAVAMRDEVREDSASAVRTLQKMGIATLMLSGDKQDVAEAVAKKVGIELSKVYAGVMPAGKAELVMQLQKANKRVAMVGDGVNDAAALAQSDVGIAMASSIGAANEVASIVLMRDKLSQVVDSIELSRLTQRKIRQNLWWAFMYNIIGLPVAAGLLLPVTHTMLTPSIAGGLMGLSSLGVMGNSLLLGREFSDKRIFGKADKRDFEYHNLKSTTS